MSLRSEEEVSCMYVGESWLLFVLAALKEHETSTHAYQCGNKFHQKAPLYSCQLGNVCAR